MKEPIHEQTRAIMKKGSKTFSFAALLFDRESREGAELLYAWCRACDDAVDNEPDRTKALAQLNRLRAETARAFGGEKSGELTFTAIELLHRQHGLKEEHATALLDGMQMDVEGAKIKTEADLELYCYRVAGVVGLMMSQIMGVSDPQAAKPAVDTGLAMQMTNIARDVREDFERGRVYLPEVWMAPPPVFESDAFVPHVRRLVDEAELLYKSGERGLRYLPLRAALAVGCAQAIYREIGREVVKRGPRAWETRTVVPIATKIKWMLIVSARVLFSRARDGGLKRARALFRTS